jgi:uncharacterized membrane protein
LLRENSRYVKETARETQMHFLEFELGSLQKALDKFDGLRFQIKNWAVTVTAALLALSVNAKDYRIALVGFAIVPLFAYLEVLNMHIQSKFIKRANRTEDLLDSMIRTDDPDYKFGIGRELELGKFDVKGLGKTLRGRPHIYVLYLGLLAVILIGVLLLKFLA